MHSTASGKTGGPQSARSRDSPPGSPGASQQTRRNGDPFPESPHVPGKTEEGQSQGPPRPQKKTELLIRVLFYSSMWKSNGRKRRGGERQEEKRIQAWGHSPLCCPVLESVRLSCWQGTKTPGSAFCPWAASWPSKKPFVCCGFSGTAGGLRWVLQVTGGSMGCLPASPGVRGGAPPLARAAHGLHQDFSAATVT